MKCPICERPSHFYARHPEADLYRCQECGHRFSVLSAQDHAEHYERDYFERTHRNWFNNPNHALFARIAKLTVDDPGVTSLIDVGCGRGAFLRHLKGWSQKQLALTGIDLWANLPEEGIEYVVGDVIVTSLNRSYDVVVSLAVIEHIADIHTFADRLHGLCRPSGRVVVMTLNDNSILYGVARALRCLGIMLPFNRLYSRHHLHHFTRRSLALLLERHGFVVETTLLHDAPLAAIDIPAPFSMAATALRLAVGALFATGRLTGRTYLQTVVCRRAGSHPMFREARKDDGIGMVPLVRCSNEAEMPEANTSL